jgi:hypothetical protein
MTATSPFYFDVTAHGKVMVRDQSTFAITTGENMSRGWESADITDYFGFKSIMDRVNVQVPVYLAMPRVYAQGTFQVGQQFDKVLVTAFKQVNAMSYMMGASITIVLQNVKVLSHTPIMQWAGLPIPPQVQKNYLEKKIGRETYIPSAVKLWVYQADVVQ